MHGCRRCVRKTYSDGLQDASNEAEERFDTDRVIETLNRFREDDPEALLDHISRTVAKYSGSAEQFDDLTMLAFRYIGS